MENLSGLDIKRIISFGINVLISIGVYLVLFYILKKRSHNKERRLPALLSKNIFLPGLLTMLALSLFWGSPMLKAILGNTLYPGINHALLVLAIVLAGWLAMRVIIVLRELLLRKYKKEDPLDFSLRKAKTKFQLIEQVLNFLIIIGTVAAILMTFESIRNVGGALLASAGVVGIILGFAAQKSLGTLFAGIQVAIAQPIRLDDVVVVEDQFGTIGEITLTYVVVHTWDGRRLMVPINYFLENSFENWTRVSPEVVGKVKMLVDYTLPIEEIREKAEKWIEASPLWDKRKKEVLVTDCKENAMEIRITMSARNPDDAWDFECLMREKLITYIREKYPQALPQSRLQITQTPGATSHAKA